MYVFKRRIADLWGGRPPRTWIAIRQTSLSYSSSAIGWQTSPHVDRYSAVYDKIGVEKSPPFENTCTQVVRLGGNPPRTWIAIRQTVESLFATWSAEGIGQQPKRRNLHPLPRITIVQTRKVPDFLTFLGMI